MRLLWVDEDVAAVEGETSVSCDSSENPLAPYQTVRAVRAASADQGEIFNVTMDGMVFTATLRAGFTFGADDVVRFRWPTEGYE